jgi:hypothetical protein
MTKKLVRRLAIWLLAFASLVSIQTAATAQPKKDVFTGIYTDMHRHPQTGDVLGVELFVVQTNRGIYVVFQDAEGTPRVPVIVPGKIKNNRIEFELPERDGYTGKFEGTITGSAIRGHFTNGQQSSSGTGEFALKRRTSFWQ